MYTYTYVFPVYYQPLYKLTEIKNNSKHNLNLYVFDLLWNINSEWFYL